MPRPKLKVSVITLFPEMFKPILELSMLGRGQKSALLDYELINLRDFGLGVHQVVDGKPYGGGVGMVFRADVLRAALKSIKKSRTYPPTVIFMTAAGNKFDQKKAKELSHQRHLIIICGHYEGVDQRFIDKYVDLELSIGDFVLTGGEIPAMAVIDAVSRLVPGVLKKPEAWQIESFENNLLEYPQYTRPAVFEGKSVPKVLVSGNHQSVDEWRKAQQEAKTAKVRPDLAN